MQPYFHTTKFKKKWNNNKHWIIHHVFFPFLAIRTSLLITAWFSSYLTPDNNYLATPDEISRGWRYSSHRLLDILGKWDGGHYLSIAIEGYHLPLDQITETQHNIAFFPFYPIFVRFFAQILGIEVQHNLELLLLIGVIISNIFFLLALILLYKLISHYFKKTIIAKNTILNILIFPTSFIFACFYSESIFLFFVVACFYAAFKKKWLFASIFASVATLTRPIGILIFFPLILEYFKCIKWKIKKIKINLIYFLLIPLSFLSFFYYSYRVSGNFLAPISAQKAWGKHLTTPWKTILEPNYYQSVITDVDRITAILFITLAITSFFTSIPVSYSLLSLLFLVPPLLTGTLTSVTRYYATIFPIFIVISLIQKKFNQFSNFIQVIFFTLQILFFTAWSLSLWVT